MQHSAEWRRCLEQLDINGVRKIDAHVNPHLSALGNDLEVLTMLHHARTQSESLPIKLRAYSHRWLTDHGYPSGLPDSLKPTAERLYPRVVDAVGIAVKSDFEVVRREVGGAMAEVVENCYADRKTAPEYVRPRMLEARLIAQKRLGV